MTLSFLQPLFSYVSLTKKEYKNGKCMNTEKGCEEDRTIKSPYRQ
ncbi:hypothetical protein BFAG_02002 [Bacteroides fragilis 3_1_12]|uniref:Uncharacterized protein n=1 Tax=Bacteroides fragilis 3_1_12 TaxID=457424 RepID=A0ABN0BKB6_BACFG|nr:hypothetical protein BFAG_02002 [Bacteroides fragilis 3_1_12]